MKIYEFISKYCQDIVEAKNERVSLLDKDELPYDELAEDESGNFIKVVYSGDKRIPIVDILELDKKDFCQIYTSLIDAETYDRYCNSIIILDGEEALAVIRNTIRKELKEIREFSKRTDSVSSIYD